MKMKLNLIISVLMIYMVSAVVAYADDWYQYHGPNRDRISTESGWDADWSDAAPKTVWKANVGIGFSSFSVADGRVYTMGNTDDKDMVWCFDALTGEEIWKYTYDCKLQPYLYEGGPGCTPTVYDGLVYTVSKEGHFYCFDAKTGEKKWYINLPVEYEAKVPEWRFAVSPLIEKDWVVLEIGFFAAFDRRSGDLVWKSAPYNASYGSPIAIDHYGKRCFAGFNEYGLVVVEAANGKEVAKFRMKSDYGINAATPIYKEGRFFISSAYAQVGKLVEVSADGSVNEIWDNRLMRTQLNAAVLWDGYLYGFDETNLRCVDFKTGEEQWMKRGLGRASLMIADGKLLILSERGDLVLAEIVPKEFKEISRATVLREKCWSVPVLANGLIYCRNAAGEVVCVDVRK